MNLRVQGATELTKTESTPRVETTREAVEQVPRLTRESEMGQLSNHEQSREVVDLVEVESAVEGINNAVEHIARGLRFSIHEGTERMMVRVVNISTDEIIKELPPEEVLDTVARIREMIGLLIDERA